jgi:hypothetical protein
MDSLVRGPGERMERSSLRGRADECALLDGLIEDIRRGESRSLVLRGEAGIGKTALLEHLIASASDLTVVRAVGVESEIELPYASLHQLCSPLLDHLAGLPPHSATRSRSCSGSPRARCPTGFSSGWRC